MPRGRSRYGSIEPIDGLPAVVDGLGTSGAAVSSITGQFPPVSVCAVGRLGAHCHIEEEGFLPNSVRRSALCVIVAILTSTAIPATVLATRRPAGVPPRGRLPHRHGPGV